MPERKLPITAVFVVYNEADLIERSLRSCADLVSEIIVVHDGACTDSTLEIARKYTAQIFELPHIGEAEPHRPFTYEKAKNDWILQLDADEFLSDDLRSNLRALISAKVDIYEVSWSTYTENKHYFWSYKGMLFKKSQVSFVGLIHEWVRPINESVVVRKTDFPLLHEPRYDNFTIKVFNSKWKKWIWIHAKQLVSDYSLVPKWNCSSKGPEGIHLIRIRHPILLGMILTPLYHFPFFLHAFVKHRKNIIIRQCLLMSLYYIFLYYYVWKLKSSQGKSSLS